MYYNLVGALYATPPKRYCDRIDMVVMGHAVPMEVVLRVRSFDTEFYKSLQVETRTRLGARGRIS